MLQEVKMIKCKMGIPAFMWVQICASHVRNETYTVDWKEDLAGLAYALSSFSVAVESSPTKSEPFHVCAELAWHTGSRRAR